MGHRGRGIRSRLSSYGPDLDSGHSRTMQIGQGCLLLQAMGRTEAGRTTRTRWPRVERIPVGGALTHRVRVAKPSQTKANNDDERTKQFDLTEDYWLQHPKEFWEEFEQDRK